MVTWNKNDGSVRRKGGDCWAFGICTILATVHTAQLHTDPVLQQRLSVVWQDNWGDRAAEQKEGSPEQGTAEEQAAAVICCAPWAHPHTKGLFSSHNSKEQQRPLLFSSACSLTCSGPSSTLGYNELNSNYFFHFFLPWGLKLRFIWYHQNGIHQAHLPSDLSFCYKLWFLSYGETPSSGNTLMFWPEEHSVNCRLTSRCPCC